MVNFRDEINRLDQEKLDQARLEKKRLNENLAKTSAVVPEVVRLFEEAADFLNETVGPTRIKMASSRTLHLPQYTPAGYLLSSSGYSIGKKPITTERIILTADGRIWRQKHGFLEISADNLGNRKIYLGNDRYVLVGDDGPIVYYNDNDGGGERTPLATWLARRVKALQENR
ncbi:hypothetical protein HQO83_06835 [Rhodococcus fascians]|nr:hypothetical protein [Rhodococcus fascians]